MILSDEDEREGEVLYLKLKAVLLKHCRKNGLHQAVALDAIANLLAYVIWTLPPEDRHRIFNGLGEVGEKMRLEIELKEEAEHQSIN